MANINRNRIRELIKLNKDYLKTVQEDVKMSYEQETDWIALQDKLSGKIEALEDLLND